VLLDYAQVYYSHLGHYRCPHCGWKRPPPTVRGCAVEPHGLDGSRLQAEVAGVPVTVELRVPGLYNAYNALAALAAAYSRGLDVRHAPAALQEVRAAFGRAECVRVDDHDVWLLLVKNPTGADEVLRLLAALPAPLELLAVLNDHAADGHDISWIWDTALEDIAGHVRHVTCAGTRAEDMALRFKYAGYSPAHSAIHHDPLAGLDAAVAATPAGAPLYVVTTYTAMLELRRGLVGRGLLRHYLDEQAVGGRR
jgi:UDP-N-acetylmuramyl tripeptide synthase